MSARIGHRPEPLFADVQGDVGVSFEFFPPRTEKMRRVSSGLRRLTASHDSKTVAQPSSLVRAVSSETLSVGA